MELEGFNDALFGIESNGLLWFECSPVKTGQVWKYKTSELLGIGVYYNHQFALFFFSELSNLFKNKQKVTNYFRSFV